METLLGHAAKAKEKLGWVPQISFAELVQEMVEADFSGARQDSLCIQAGFTVPTVQE